jgi:hypothetical protein
MEAPNGVGRMGSILHTRSDGESVDLLEMRRYMRL